MFLLFRRPPPGSAIRISSSRDVSGPLLILAFLVYRVRYSVFVRGGTFAERFPWPFSHCILTVSSLGKRRTDAMVTVIHRLNAKTLTVNEIYQSAQGESTWAGLPCVFVRLTFCDLRCTYCDTAYAFYKGTKIGLPEVVERVMAYECPLVEVTGGEPLLQKNVLPLMRELCDRGLTVLIETSGAHDISAIDPRVHRIMDLKTPSSGECDRNRFENIQHLKQQDEVKFVIGSREDYLWAKAQIKKFNLAKGCGTILFSPVFGKIEPRDIVEWLLADKLPVRFQLQMHKFIWAPETKGV